LAGHRPFKPPASTHGEWAQGVTHPTKEETVGIDETKNGVGGGCSSPKKDQKGTQYLGKKSRNEINPKREKRSQVEQEETDKKTVGSQENQLAGKNKTTGPVKQDRGWHGGSCLVQKLRSQRTKGWETSEKAGLTSGGRRGRKRYQERG